MKLRNTNPLGAVDLPLLGRVLEPGEVFEVDDKTGRALLEQSGNYAPADPQTPRKTRKPKTTASAPAAPADTEEKSK